MWITNIVRTRIWRNFRNLPYMENFISSMYYNFDESAYIWESRESKRLTRRLDRLILDFVLCDRAILSRAYHDGWACKIARPRHRGPFLKGIRYRRQTACIAMTSIVYRTRVCIKISAFFVTFPKRIDGFSNSNIHRATLQSILHKVLFETEWVSGMNIFHRMGSLR